MKYPRNPALAAVSALALFVAAATSGFVRAEEPGPGDGFPLKQIVALFRAKVDGFFLKIEQFELRVAEDVFTRANKFQDDYRGRTDFDLKTAEVLAADLETVATKFPIDAKVRSQAMLALAGVDGMIAKKLGRPAGLGRGTRAFKELRSAVALDPESRPAAQGYCMTIAGMTAESGATRVLIEWNLGISLKTESRSAIAMMARLKMNGYACVAKLEKFLVK